MIKKIKYAVYAVLTFCFLIYCGETAYARYTDKMNDRFECLLFLKTYNSNSLGKDLLELSESYGICGFLTVYEYGECEKETHCCTTGDTDYICSRLGIKPCSFDTIADSSYAFDFKELSRWVDSDKERLITAFHYDGSRGDIAGFARELSAKYDISRMPRLPYSNSALPVGAACIVLILLLTVYDMMSVRRDVCIQLTLGRGLFVQVLRYQLRDMAVYTAVGVVLSLLLRNVTGIPLCRSEITAYLVAVCVLNSLVFGLLYAVDICSVLKRSNESVLFLPINYTLKIISAVLMTVLVSYATVFVSELSVISEAEKQREFFSPYSFIELSESPYWSELIDGAQGESNVYKEDDLMIRLLTEEMEDYGRYIEDMHDGSGFFLLHAFECFYIPEDLEERSAINCVIASDDALSYIEEQTGTELGRDRLTLLLPDTYLNKDLNTVKDWIKNDLTEYGTVSNVLIKNYGKADIAAFGYFDSAGGGFASNRKFDILSSPMIICIPDSSAYGFLQTQEFFAAADGERALAVLDELSIRSAVVDVCPVGVQISGYVKEKKALLLIYLLMTVTVTVYGMSVFYSTAVLDIKLKQKHRAILKVLGHGFCSRHMGSYLAVVPATVLPSAAAAVWLLRLLRVHAGMLTVAAVAAILAAETAAFFLLARSDESKNTIKALKGGAL